MYQIHGNLISTNEFQSLVWRWYLERPQKNLITRSETLEFTGWVICQNTGSSIVPILGHKDGSISVHSLDQHRLDVIKATKVADGEKKIVCGFRFSTLLGLDGIKFGFRIDGQDHWTHEFYVSPVVKVLEGKDNFLFLDNDTNKSVEQFRGDLLLSDGQINAWRTHLSEIERMAAKVQAKMLFIIAPSKEELFLDKYPYSRGNLTPIDQLVDAFEGNSKFLYPLHELAEEREFTYNRVDTHWNDYGAKIAARRILSKFGLHEFSKVLVSSFKVTKSGGDLGANFEPARLSTNLVADYKGTPPVMVFDNSVLNHGRLWVFENEQSPVSDTLIIFGGSSAYSIAPILSYVFRRVVYAYTAGNWVQSIVDHESPGYVLLQTNQRFIVTPPNTAAEFWREVAAKIAVMSQSQAKALKMNMRRAMFTFNAAYAEKILELFQRARTGGDS